MLCVTVKDYQGRKKALIENVAKKVNITYQTIAKYFDNQQKRCHYHWN